jgi:hypothetical protein
MIKLNYKFLCTFLFLVSTIITAKENDNVNNSNFNNPLQTLAFNCAAGTAQTLLDINNVKTTILNGGDMWWDLNNGRYEIPQGSGKHSMFAGALWIGGLDDQGNLKVAGQTYRQSGNDFWPGPLDNVRLTEDQFPNPNYGSTDASICAQYDNHHVIYRTEVEEFIGYLNSDEPSVDFPDYSIPKSILEYPGNRNTDNLQGGFSGYDAEVSTAPYYAQESLAPFYDANGDGFYDPLAGDYPEYNIDGNLNCKEADMLFGDQTLWWVYNDNGNIHTESQSETSIGIEIQAQAFAFSTNDEINNMTFYNYKIINRSHQPLNETWFGVWVDPDLGDYQDDYVGCDVQRGLGYCYNGDEDDGTAVGYGSNPPAIGVDFFRGPLADEEDGLDNDGDGEIDEPGEQIIMSKFVYYNNINGTVDGNPDVATDYYNYLRGIWLDNQPMTYGADGRDPSGIPCSYMFPGDTDPQFSDVWTEQTAGNPPADRRFIQSAGPFTLEPGALNTITTGVVWARANEGGAFASVELMRLADDKAQKLFDVCFEVLDGPDAPNLTIQELDKELIITLTNSNTSNNYQEAYLEADEVNILGFYDEAQTDTFRNEYSFEGYQIFQLKDETVTASDVYDVEKARLIFQCDIRNFKNSNGLVTLDEDGNDPIAQLTNFYFDQELQASVPQNMTIEASNSGISHSVSILQDLFASGNNSLINNKTYYYLPIAYAYNEFLEYSPDQVPDPNDPYAPSLLGQKKPFLAGRKNIKQYTGIPHKPNAEFGGTIQNSDYGTIPNMKRIEGIGNGGLELELSDETKNLLITQFCAPETGYAVDGAPVNIKVVDPLGVPQNTEFTFKLIGSGSNAEWILVNNTLSDTVFSEQVISVKNEQLIPEWGLSVTLLDGINPGDDGTDVSSNNGFLSAVEIKDNSTSWLDYINDSEDFFQTQAGDWFIYPENWIRSGTDSTDFIGIDDSQSFEKILNGVWAPYRLVGADSEEKPFAHSPVYNAPGAQFQSRLDYLTSVDIVFTEDKSLWTRCPVIETATVDDRLSLKSNPSVDKFGNPDNSGTNGFSWFPGYAIDLDKGIRLNIMFGESSDHPNDNGDDMLWNPSSRVDSGDQFGAFFSEFSGSDAEYDVIFGGRHYTYIMGSPYAGDSPQNHPFYNDLTNMTSAISKKRVFRDARWVSIPMLSSTNAIISDGEIEVKIRVSTEYDQYQMDDSQCESSVVSENSGNIHLKFNTNDIQTITNNNKVAKNALDLIKIVPNPYYGSNNYEKDQVDQRVRITNLPTKCNISIYNVSGTLIRQVSLDSDINVTGWDWDLKNNDNVAIASGVYIVHIDAGDLGQKVLKWFGALRPIDLDSF